MQGGKLGCTYVCYYDRASNTGDALGCEGMSV